MKAFTKSKRGDIVTIKFKENFTQEKISDLRPVLRDSLEKGVKTVKIDFANVEHIDSPGIGLLVATYNTLQTKEGELIINNVKSDIVELFSVLQLDRRFTIKPAVKS